MDKNVSDACYGINSSVAELTDVLKSINNNLAFISHELKIANAMRNHQKDCPEDPFNRFTLVLYQDMVEKWMKQVMDEANAKKDSKIAPNEGKPIN